MNTEPYGNGWGVKNMGRLLATSNSLPRIGKNPHQIKKKTITRHVPKRVTEGKGNRHKWSIFKEK